jgi:ketosteroid isomerase-like protein
MKPRFVLPFLPVLLLSLLLLSCGRGQPKQEPPPQRDLADVRSAIEKISARMQQAVLEGDHATQLSFLAEDVIIDPPLDPPVRGKAAVQEQFARAKKEGQTYRSFSGTTEALWVVGDSVYERGTWGMSFTTNEMKKPFSAYGSFFEIWARDGSGGYRIAYLIYSLDMNPYERER